MITPRRLLAAAVLGTLALTGCSQTPGVAARIDGATLSEAQVTKAAATVAAVQKDADQGLYYNQVASFYVQGLVAAKVGAAQGVAVSDATRAQVLAGQASLAQWKQAGAGDFTDRLADYLYVRKQLGDEKYFAGCSTVPVSVNPHYGNWSKELCALDGQSGSLSRAIAKTAG